MVYKKSAFIKIKKKISHAKIDALLISDPFDINYLTGFHSPGALLVITKKDFPVYFIDIINKTLGEKLLCLNKVHLVTAKKSVINSFANFLKEKKVKTLGFNNGDMSVSFYKSLLDLVPKIKLVSKINSVPAGRIVEEIREIKSEEEIMIIRKAAKETVRIWRKIRKDVKPGITEKELAVLIDVVIRRSGYENSFPTIVASGENTAYPHAVPTDKRLKKNEHVLVDFGIRIKGYSSDLTRTLYNGRINPQIENFHKFVLEAHKKAIEKIKPGISLGSLSGEINRLFKNNNMYNYVLHGLGHGIGQKVHETPFFQENCRVYFKKGMVLTVEPGLYKKGLGGVREEDMILVTANGCEVLTR